MPSVAIALAAYQPELSVFAEQLRSIQEQSFKDWVCIITSDSPLGDLLGSAAMQPFKSDSRFVWQENPNRLGHKRNFEKAIQLAAQTGARAIGCSDQDDVWYPEKLAVSLAALEQAGPGALVHCDMHVLTAGKILDRTTWQIENRGVDHARPGDLFVRNVVAGCAMLMDGELARRFPSIPEAAEYHDHWYALIASFFGGVHPIRKPLFAYRQHGDNVVGVTAYRSYFAMPRTLRYRDILDKCARGWRKSRTLAQAAKDAGLPLTPELERCFLGSADFGAGLLFKSLTSRQSDPPLSRASLVRGLGKLATGIHLAKV